jgi:hypothetical protein
MGVSLVFWYDPKYFAYLGNFLQAIKTQPSFIKSLPMNGSACVIGTSSGKVLKSPISGKPCVYWEIDIRTYDWSLGNMRYKPTRWINACRVFSINTFEVIDETETLLISPETIYIIGGSFRFIDESSIPILRKLGVKTKDLGSITKIREFIVEIDKPITVWGTVSMDGKMKILKHTRKIPLLISRNDLKTSRLDLFLDMILALYPFIVLVLFAFFVIFIFSIKGIPQFNVIFPWLFLLVLIFVFFLGNLADKRNNSE